jgi:hypothetical protein
MVAGAHDLRKYDTHQQVKDESRLILLLIIFNVVVHISCQLKDISFKMTKYWISIGLFGIFILFLTDRNKNFSTDLIIVPYFLCKDLN